MNLSDRASPPAAPRSVSGRRRPAELTRYAVRHLVHALGEAGYAAVEEWREWLPAAVISPEN